MGHVGTYLLRMANGASLQEILEDHERWIADRIENMRIEQIEGDADPNDLENDYRLKSAIAHMIRPEFSPEATDERN